MKKFSIAIDGPAGAGKSTVAKEIAKRLNFIYIDTGAMYRAFGLYYLKNNISLDNEEDVNKYVSLVTIEMENQDGENKLFLNQEDVTKEIRTEEASRGASKVSVYPKVREKMVELQQEIASKNNVVMDGRDIGTVVLPEATLKIYLTASVLVRAERRYKEQMEKGMDVNLEDIKKDIEERDYRDMNRETSPLKQASDAILVDTSSMNKDEVISEILKLCQDRGIEL